MPYVAQVAVGRRPKLSIYGSDYETPDGTGMEIVAQHNGFRKITMALASKVFVTTST